MSTYTAYVPTKYESADMVQRMMLAFRNAIIDRKDEYDVSVLGALLIQAHPWTRKYLMVGYSEANQLLEMSREDGFAITEVEPCEIEKKHSASTGRLIPLRFSASSTTTKSGRFVWSFRRHADGTFSF